MLSPPPSQPRVDALTDAMAAPGAELWLVQLPPGVDATSLAGRVLRSPSVEPPPPGATRPSGPSGRVHLGGIGGVELWEESPALTRQAWALLPTAGGAGGAGGWRATRCARRVTARLAPGAAVVAAPAAAELSSPELSPPPPVVGAIADTSVKERKKCEVSEGEEDRGGEEEGGGGEPAAVPGANDKTPEARAARKAARAAERAAKEKRRAAREAERAAKKARKNKG